MPRTIDVIGRGRVGHALAERWRDAGHDVLELGRDDPVRATSEVVLLAIPSSVVVEAVGGRAADLADKVVIDATNDVSGAHPDLAGAIAAAAPAAQVVKAFNTVFATFYAEPLGSALADMAYCTDAAPRALVEQLIQDAGFRPVDTGPLAAAPDLEGMARMVIRTATAVGRGPFTYRFPPRDEHAG
jgi:8-hydroxy-5-deazaflavin:NADPH oxidoreductase